MSWTPRGRTVVAFAMLFVARGTWAGDSAADEVAARVNGTVISRQAVRAIVQAIAAEQETPPDSKQIEQITRDALDSLIAFELLYQESQRRNIAVSDAEVDADIARTKAHFGDAGTYDAALAQRGMTLDDVRRDTRKTLAVNRLLEQTAWQNIQVPPDRVKRFYEENREQFKRPAELRCSHILLRAASDASGEQRTQAKQQAEALAAQIRGGADFAELARQHSQDPVTASKGGDLGFFARGTMEPNFETAAFALKPGGVSDVVQTRYGFHVIKVTDQHPAGYPPLTDVQGDITALLRDEAKRSKQDEFVASLKQQAKVDFLPLLKPTPPPKKASH